jgi:hypothetical protein
MSSYRQQAHIEAPLTAVWELVGSPQRHPEWWPRVIEVRGERFEEGDEYVQVVRNAFGPTEASFLLEEVEDLREIQMRCTKTGMYAHWLLTEAQGGTFVEMEMGMDAKTLPDKLFDAVAGNRYFRRWGEESFDALRRAAGGAPGPG